MVKILCVFLALTIIESADFTLHEAHIIIVKSSNMILVFFIDHLININL